MDATVPTPTGVLTFRDVHVHARTVTATLNGNRVTLPKDRLLAQKMIVARERQARRGLR
jgi:hypothetical protein